MRISVTKTFDCDDRIAKLIVDLNNKGYTTTFCCEGHPYGAYILFDRSTAMSLEHQKYNHPNNWIITRANGESYIGPFNEIINDNELFYKWFQITRIFTQEEILTMTDEQLSDMVTKELSDWVEYLPDINKSWCAIKAEIL